MTDKDVFQAACGVTEDKDNKSLIKIETKFIHTENGGSEETVEQRTLDGPIINIFRSLRYTMVDIQFADNCDYDYINVTQMLKNFCTPKNSMDTVADKIPAIVLTVMPKSLQGQYYICAMHGTWCLMPSKPNRMADTIRFIFDNELIHTYQINPEKLDYDGVEEEMTEDAMKE